MGEKGIRNALTWENTTHILITSLDARFNTSFRDHLELGQTQGSRICYAIVTEDAILSDDTCSVYK